jgi:hypothetical protein
MDEILDRLERGDFDSLQLDLIKRWAWKATIFVQDSGKSHFTLGRIYLDELPQPLRDIFVVRIEGKEESHGPTISGLEEPNA